MHFREKRKDLQKFKMLLNQPCETIWVFLLIFFSHWTCSLDIRGFCVKVREFRSVELYVFNI